MKELIAVVAVIILGIAVGGVIVGFKDTADNIGTQAEGLGGAIVDQWEAEAGLTGLGD
jgi:hypothetical protein